MQVSEFDYVLPQDRIAQIPAEPRDSARLLVTDGLVDTTFDRLGEQLQPGDLVVVNDVRVRAARLHGHRPGGGKVELLLLGPTGDGDWDALAKPARKLRPGMALSFADLSFRVKELAGDGRVRVEPTSSRGLEARIERVGTVPMPPYVRAPVDPGRYQTIFANGTGAAAAPTAGLHFTPDLVERLTAAGVRFASITLFVGLATFRPIATETVEEHEMHTEEYSIPEGLGVEINAARRVVAVGTTTVRALESAWAEDGLVSGRHRSDLFIRPGFQPRVVDALITNFHMPRSSLLVMISAFLPKWREVYEYALENGYRFLSFGDAMYIPDVKRDS